jgi:hypothetical protein
MWREVSIDRRARHTDVHAINCLRTHSIDSRRGTQLLLFLRASLHHEEVSVVVPIHVYETCPEAGRYQLKQLEAVDLHIEASQKGILRDSNTCMHQGIEYVLLATQETFFRNWLAAQETNCRRTRK